MPSPTQFPSVPSSTSSSSAALPYTLTTPPTTTRSIVIRRITAVGTAAILLFLLPIPRASNHLPTLTSHAYLSFIPRLLDSTLTNLLYLLTLTFSYHLALHTAPISLNSGRSIPTQWLLPGASAVVGLAAAADDTWIRTNVLWDVVVVIWVCGWRVMSVGERERLGKWAEKLVLGMVVREFIGTK